MLRSNFCELQTPQALLLLVSVCVCVFVFFPFILDMTSSSLDVPAGVTQDEGHTEDSAILSLVDGEIEFCVLTI